MIDINTAAAWFQGRITVTSLEAEGHFSGSRVSFFPVGHRCTWWPALSGPWVACSADQLRGWTQALKIQLQNFSGSQVNVYLPPISWIVSIKLMRMNRKKNRRRSFHFVPAILWNLLYLCWNPLYLWNTLYLWNALYLWNPLYLWNTLLSARFSGSKVSLYSAPLYFIFDTLYFLSSPI